MSSPFHIIYVFEGYFVQHEQLERYMTKSLIYSLLWSIAGDGRLKVRQELGDYIRAVTTIPLPAGSNLPIIDFEVRRDFMVVDRCLDSFQVQIF